MAEQLQRIVQVREWVEYDLGFPSKSASCLVVTGSKYSSWAGGTKGTDVELMDWERFIMMIVQRILEEQSPQSLLTIRGYYYELLTRLIPAPVILKEIVKQLIARCPSKSLQMETVCWASTYEQKMRQGGKEIVFLEAFTARFMSLYKQNLLRK